MSSTFLSDRNIYFASIYSKSVTLEKSPEHAKTLPQLLQVAMPKSEEVFSLLYAVSSRFAYELFRLHRNLRTISIPAVNAAASISTAYRSQGVSSPVRTELLPPPELIPPPEEEELP